jgi:methionine-gamma-lyase
MKKELLSIETICATDGVENLKNAHNFPLFASSTFIYESPDAAAEIFSGKAEGFIYSRWNHPNAALVEAKIALLESYGLKENAIALAFSSGMAALNALFQSLLKSGDAILAQGNIYGTSVDYFNHFGKQFGVEVIYEDFKNLNVVEEHLKKHKNIKVLYAETPSNPTINCYDLKALKVLSKKYASKLCVDNTFATPLLQQPLSFGADFVLHSATKFLNGHGNALSGVLVSNDISLMRDLVWKVRKLHGSIVSPFDAWLLNTGMKTLPLRMHKHCQNALMVANFLNKHKAIASVNYLGLANHADHQLAKTQMKNFGGVLSFEMKDGKRAGKKLMQRLSLCKLTASLGTCDTLIQHPASMSHSFVPKAQREKFGITDGLVRLSVGLENVDDILNDLAKALM